MRERDPRRFSAQSVPVALDYAVRYLLTAYSPTTGSRGAQGMTDEIVASKPRPVAFLFLQRYWQLGLASGAVKG